jgi:ribosomal protein S18 acetylase RimI-like enzyme
MVAGTDIQIVEARKEHAPFIAWVMLTAARSHLPVGMWDLLCGGSERETLRLLEALATTGDAHWAHYSLFFVAEVDGQPASALAAYIERENGAHTLLEPLRAANATVARADDDLAAGWARAGSIGRVNPQHDPTTLVVEHVATLPDYRRQGLIDRLLAAALDRGRSRGAALADVGVLIGNDRAQRAYEKAGFRVVDELLDAEFEAAYDCAGIRALRQSI